MTTIDIDYSLVSMIASCPAKYGFEHKLGLKRPTNNHLYLGSAIHMTAEGYYRNRLDGIDMPSEDFVDMFNDIFKSGEPARARDGTLLDIKWDTPYDSVLTMGLDMARAYYNLASQVTPIMVEQHLARQVTIGEHEVNIYGTIDLVLDDGRPVDIKTAGRKPWQTDLDASLQPTFYFYLLGGEGEFVYHHIIKAVPSQVIQSKTNRSAVDLRWLQDALRHYTSFIVGGGPYTPNRTNMCQYCAYKVECLSEGALAKL